MLLQPVAVPVLQHSRLAYTHLIGNHAPVVPGEWWDKIAIQVAPCRIAMHHHHPLPAPFVHVVHVESGGCVVVRYKRECFLKSLISYSKHRTSQLALHIGATSHA